MILSQPRPATPAEKWFAIKFMARHIFLPRLWIAVHTTPPRRVYMHCGIIHERKGDALTQERNV